MPPSDAGWFPDPFGRYELRYFNGTAWTADVSAAGNRFVDSLGTDPSSAGPPASGPRRRNGLGVAAMVLGIVGAAIAWLPFVFVVGALCGVLAIIFAIVARRRKATHGRSQGATVGLVLGPIALVLAVGGFVLTRVVLDVIHPGDYAVEVTSCRADGDRQVMEGVIHNQSGRDRSYTVFVEFVRDGTRNVLEQARTDVDDVPEGGSAPFTVSVQSSGVALDCRVDTVTGSLDFLD